MLAAIMVKMSECKSDTKLNVYIGLIVFHTLVLIVSYALKRTVSSASSWLLW